MTASGHIRPAKACAAAMAIAIVGKRRLLRQMLRRGAHR